MENFITEKAYVVYIPAQKLIYFGCQGFLAYEELVHATEYAYKMIQFYKLSKCVINLQEVSLYPHGTKEYFGNIWYGKLFAAGIRRIAFVVPIDVFNKSCKAIVNAGSFTKSIGREYFADETSAGNWLNTCPDLHC
jgi:hypothetical protein